MELKSVLMVEVVVCLWVGRIPLLFLLGLSPPIILMMIGNSWRLTGFYGTPETGNRHETWNLLRRLNNTTNTPWCVVGDFNEIILATEKQGGLVRNNSQMQNFRDALSDCHLEDMGYRGNWFTWE
ncbi:hypothetical protein V6N11_058891 [Hibiscus sabdariffa]|uniref:Exo_endo_phos domain-containing protein n=1 Tax=Hibiscus sabdariffa TaxID=183260 RepID=A0ABR2U5K7_9ROSI